MQSTAQLIMGTRNCSIMFDVRLREVLLGVFQGLTRDQIAERYPYDLTHWDTDPCYVVPGGESRNQLMERAFAAWRDITDQHVGERVLVVSHGGTLRQMMIRVLQPDSSIHLRFANTSLTILERADQGGWTIRCLNSIPHLQDRYVNTGGL
jgi:broad specificity phosphatase PhoE